MNKDLPEGQTQSVDEQRILMEANCIAAEDEYFAARPQIDSMDRRRVYEAGFKRAWQAAKADSQAELKFERQAKWELAQQLSAANQRIAELEALIKESQEQEPVAWANWKTREIIKDEGDAGFLDFVPLYSFPIIGEKK